MPKGFTDHEKELIRQRLLEQGYKQFSSYGLKKATVEDLAAAAGISKGAFYQFYESKEALFMQVLEERAERRFRQEMLAMLDLPGPSPRANLLALLQKAFSLFKTMPMLRFMTGGDYDLLFRRIPAEALQEHLAGDRQFFADLVTRCQAAGIPICVRPEEMNGLLYALVLSVMHEDGLGAGVSSGAIDVLLELVAAYCLGEVSLGTPVLPGLAPRAQ